MATPQKLVTTMGSELSHISLYQQWLVDYNTLDAADDSQGDKCKARLPECSGSERKGSWVAGRVCLVMWTRNPGMRHWSDGRPNPKIGLVAAMIIVRIRGLHTGLLWTLKHNVVLQDEDWKVLVSFIIGNKLILSNKSTKNNE